MINNVSGDFTISDHNENILNQSKKLEKCIIKI